MSAPHNMDLDDLAQRMQALAGPANSHVDPHADPRIDPRLPDSRIDARIDPRIRPGAHQYPETGIYSYSEQAYAQQNAPYPPAPSQPLPQPGVPSYSQQNPVQFPYPQQGIQPSQPVQPYQGAPLPIGPPSNRTIPPYEAYQDVRMAPPPPPASPIPYPSMISAVPHQNNYGPAHPVQAAYPDSARAANPYTEQSQPPIQPGQRDANSAAATATAAAVAAATASALTNPGTEDPQAHKSGLNRVINAVRSTMPLVQKLLPLLDGNFATAISTLVAPALTHHPAPPPPQVRVDLEPLERGLTDLRTSHRELRTQIAEQGTSLKRVEDQLERVREATDRNTLEQQELIEDLRSTGSRIGVFAIIGLILLVISVAVNAFFLVQLQHILR